MHNSESVPENEMQKLLSDFEIQADHQISARQADLVIVSKKKKKEKKRENLQNSGLCRSGGPQNKNQRKRKER